VSDFLLSQAEIDALLAQDPPAVQKETRQADSLQQELVRQTVGTKNQPAAEHPNLERILDIPLQLKVLLGKASKPISEVVALSPGSIVEFDRIISEPVDILLKEKLIARGEVVVVDEHFGIRITQIVSPQERVRKMV
jgi:flagellar motor switch protein FliN/FliY